MLSSIFKTKSNQSYFYLLIGFTFLFFYNGRWIIPIAAFLALFFLMRFMRYQKPFKGFLLVILAGWLSNIFIWKGMMPITGFFYYFLMLIMSVFTALTFLIDRVYTQKIKGIISSLVFPSAFVIMDYIVVSTNPGGSNGALAHTQSALALLQIVSVTGIWGLTFLITWTASVINWLWDNSFEKKKIFSSLIVYGIPILIIILYGQIRLAMNNEYGTVRIASINIDKPELYYHFNENADSINEKINNKFLHNCNIAAFAGAKIVFGIEAIITLSEGTEKGFIEKAKTTALKDSIYLGLPMCIIHEGFPDIRPENKIVWISPKGQILFSYNKAKPTPGEGKYGDGKLKYFDSPYGRISSAICFDMDFPALINQISKANIDIMLVPGNDWCEISPYHTYLSSFRAIEHGFNMVRSVSKGFSASFNYKGQLLSSMDYFKTNELILYSDLQTKGQNTIYSLLGDYFAWLCIAFFLVITGFIIIRK
jgi:apolipoprotein N-acyltransferase